MPADRLFHPKLGHSEKVCSLSHLEARVWFQYILSADDFGVMRFSAQQIRADNEALERENELPVSASLERLVSVGLVSRFDHQNQPFIFQHDWQDYQKVRYPRDTYLPCPPSELLLKCSGNTFALFRDYHKKFPVSDPLLARVRTRETANGKRLTATANGNGSPVPELMRHYHDRYLTALGEKPEINGAKDGAILRRLARTHGAEKVRARIDALLASTDPFIAKTGRTIGVLKACWNSLGQARSAPVKPMTVDERRRAEAVRRANGGCMHDPRCGTSVLCLVALVNEWRSQTGEPLIPNEAA